jgi:hypothetical protein
MGEYGGRDRPGLRKIRRRHLPGGEHLVGLGEGEVEVARAECGFGPS